MGLVRVGASGILSASTIATPDFGAHILAQQVRVDEEVPSAILTVPDELLAGGQNEAGHAKRASSQPGGPCWF